MIDLMSYALSFDKSKAVPLGYPRNDALTGKKFNLKELFSTECEKVIVWYPTFRQHKAGFSTAANHALPIIHNEEFALSLNECAKRNGVLIVLKPHFAQDLSYIKRLSMSNIKFIDDSFFEKNNISSYEFVGSTDALISDYSSIYYDYTLCDKPIAVIWEDIEEYKKNPGLIDDYEKYLAGAEKIYTLDELLGFVERVSSGIDLNREQREQIKNLVNISDDGKNTCRVVDFIIEKAKL